MIWGGGGCNTGPSPSEWGRVGEGWGVYRLSGTGDGTGLDLAFCQDYLGSSWMAGKADLNYSDRTI